MREMSRTINKTKVNYVSMAVGESIDMADVKSIEIPGVITKQSKLMLAVRRELGKDANFLIVSSEIVDEKRAISYDDFMKYSHPVTEKEGAEEEEDIPEGF